MGGSEWQLMHLAANKFETSHETEAFPGTGGGPDGVPPPEEPDELAPDNDDEPPPEEPDDDMSLAAPPEDEDPPPDKAAALGLVVPPLLDDAESAGVCPDVSAPPDELPDDPLGRTLVGTHAPKLPEPEPPAPALQAAMEPNGNTTANRAATLMMKTSKECPS